MPIGPQEQTDRQTLTPAGAQGVLDETPNPAADRRDERGQEDGRPAPSAPIPETPPAGERAKSAILDTLDGRMADLEDVAGANLPFENDIDTGEEFYPVLTSAAGNLFFCVTQSTDTVVLVGPGYGCYAGTWTEISDGTDTITGYSTNGTNYASVKLDLATGTWSLEKTDGALPTNTDSVQYWVLAKVTVASNVISAIEQRWFGGWAIYETRA